MYGVSVIVPVLNASRTLPVCLGALARLNPPPLEIILVDNGSTDGSLPSLQAFAAEHRGGMARVVREARRGAAAARNAGLRVAEGEVIAFTDADCAPEASWLRHLLGPFRDRAVGAVAGRVIAAPASSAMELFSALYTLQLPDEPSRHRAWTPWEGGFPTANLCVRRSLLMELAGFDKGLGTYGEDYDLCARLYALGAEISYAPEACVTHYHRTTLRAMARQAFGFGRAHAVLFRRYAGPGLWLDFPRGSRRWPASPIHAWIDIASADKKLLAALAAGILYAPLPLALIPLLVGWLANGTRQRASRSGIRISPITALALAGSLMVKSAAMTCGRWWGSMKYGALCF